MAAEIVNVQDAKTHLSRLLAEVESGADVVIRGLAVVARLVALRPIPRRELGFVAAVLPVDFDAPLPESELAAWA